MTGEQGEFGLIAKFFAPLAGPEGLGLGDDAALLAPPPAGSRLAVTCDTMVAGIHFLAHDPPDAIGHKLLAVNLSDLAAMGAEPSHYLLAATFPEPPDETWLTGFTAGLRRMQQGYGVALVGGDTTRTTGPLTLTVTAFGHVPAADALRRSTARPGDVLFVSGTIGDAALALHLSQDKFSSLRPDMVPLLERLHRPTPRVALGRALRGIASAAMDVSDGLVGDLGHIADQSKVGALIRTARLPLSPAAAQLLAEMPELLSQVMTGGDDYELLFTAPPAARQAVLAAAETAATPVTEIGVIESEPGIRVRDRHGAPVILEGSGYRHF